MLHLLHPKRRQKERMLHKHCFLTAALCGILVLGNSSLAAVQTVGPNGEAATPSSALTD
jgi:hypothetical protein